MHEFHHPGAPDSRTPEPVPAAGVSPTRHPWLVLVLLCTAQFMLILDITVVNVALPSIQADIALSGADLPWVVTAYTLAFGGLIILGGRAGDVFGRRRMFLTGLAVFTAASLGAALAADPATLIVARATQGVGAALLSPAALSLITTVIPDGRVRHRALAAWAAVGAGGGAVGVLVGGVLTTALGWEAIFVINVPVGIALIVATARTVPGRQPSTGGRLDIVGALLATGSLVALIYGLTRAEAVGWTSGQTLGMFALAAAGLAAFVGSQRVIAQPLVPLAVFTRRPVALGVILMILGMGPVFSAFFFSSLYLQHVLEHSALRTGVQFLPIAIAIVVAAHAGGRLIAPWGARPVIAVGLTLGAGGALLLGGVSVEGSYWSDVLPGFLLLGAGGGLAASGVMITAMSGARADDSGLVSGLTNTAHELSIALTVPVLTTIAASRAGAAAFEPGREATALTEGIAGAFQAAAVMALVGAVVAATLLRRTDVTSAPTGLHAMH